MSRAPTIQTFVSKKKETSTLTFEQVTDPDNYTKKRQTAPMEMTISGASASGQQSSSKKVERSKIKPRLKGYGFIGLLDNPDDYTEIPKPVPLIQTPPALKLKTYNGRSK
jgi:hypothetical protein